MRICVIDASVIAKWLLKDEQDCTAALDLKRDLTDGRIAVIVPSLVRYEIASLLSIAVRRGRLSAADAAYGLRCVLDIGLITCDDPEAVSHSFILSCETQGSVYDCAYLSTAISLACDLHTADEKFIAAARGIYGRVKHISEYSAERL